MNDILRMREICKEHKSCHDGCPFYTGNECVLSIPPSSWSDEQLYQIDKVLGYKEAESEEV